MKGILRNTLGVTFILIPLLALLIIFLEGGLLGVALYMAYIISTFIILKLPIIGLKLLRGGVRMNKFEVFIVVCAFALPTAMFTLLAYVSGVLS